MSWLDATTMLDDLRTRKGVSPQTDQKSRRRPQPPRNVVAQQAASSYRVTWNAPQDARGIAGYHVWAPNENVLNATISDATNRQFTISGTNLFIAVSSFNELGVESAKIPASVVPDTGGLPPDWPGEGGGGGGGGGPIL